MKKLITMGAVLLAVLGTYAQNMGASEAQKRVLEAEQPVAEAPAEQAPVEQEAPAPEAIDSVELGVIKTLGLSGSVEFAVEEGAYRMLKADLCDGKVKTIGDLKAAFAKCRNELVKKGFYLANVGPDGDSYDPARQHLVVLVDSGKFGDVKVQMDEGRGKWYSAESVEKRIDTINKDEPFNYNRLRRALSSVNNHPDITADTRLKIRAAKEDETVDSRVTRYADVDLTVRDEMPLHAVWELNNYGLKDIDEWQTSLTFQYLNLTGADDTITVSPAISLNGDMKSIAAGYARPFDLFNGGSWTVYGGYSDLDTDEILPQLDLDGTGWFTGVNTSWYLVDDEDKNIAFNVGILYRKMEDYYSVKAYKLNILDREIGVLPLTMGVSYADKHRDALGGRNFASASVSFNIARDGDPARNIYDKAEDHYFLSRAEVARLQSLFTDYIPDGEEWRAWSTFMKLSAQYSPDVLIPAEKLSIGGINTVRGYRSRGYMGDSGVYGTLELRTPVLTDTIAGIFRDSNGKTALDRMQFYAFTDAGYTRYNRMTMGYADSEFLAAIGVGTRFGLTKYCQLNLDLAMPLRETKQDKIQKSYDENVELYLSLKSQF